MVFFQKGFQQKRCDIRKNGLFSSYFSKKYVITRKNCIFSLFFQKNTLSHAKMVFFSKKFSTKYVVTRKNGCFSTCVQWLFFKKVFEKIRCHTQKLSFLKNFFYLTSKFLQTHFVFLSSEA